MSDDRSPAPPIPSADELRRKRRLVPLTRTAERSPFSVVLERLVHQVPGCLSASFVDQEGEAVDVAGYGTEFQAKVVGAYCNVLVSDAAPLGHLRDLVISARRRSYLIRCLPEGYVLALELARGAAPHVSERALGECTLALASEAGFEVPPRPVRWHAAEVRPRGNRKTRPQEIRAKDAWHSLQVLGSIVGVKRGERGYRVRVATGAEVTLVREPLGRWWTDDRIE
jgi:hypothetical protein